MCRILVKSTKAGTQIIYLSELKYETFPKIQNSGGSKHKFRDIFIQINIIYIDKNIFLLSVSIV